MTDEQYEALQQYVYHVSTGDGSVADRTVKGGGYIDWLVVNGYVKRVNSHYCILTDRGHAAYWNESYIRMKDVLHQIRRYIVLAVSNAKDVDALRSRLQGVLMIANGDIQLINDEIHFANKAVLPADYDVRQLEEDEE